MVEESKEIELINGSRIKVRFIWRFFGAEGGPPYYPQALRAWPEQLSEKLRPQYEKMERTYAGQLAAMVAASSACIFSPPSRYPFAATYRDACKDRQAGNLDISTRFRKLDTSVIAGENDTTAEDIYRSLAYDAAGDEPDIAAIIMVDDVVAGGKTAIAALSHLTEAGLPLDADITVASLLRLNPT